MRLKVYIQPNSSSSCFCGEYADMLKIRIKSPATEGKANKELIRFLSKKLKINKSNICIKHGKQSRIKLLEITGITDDIEKLIAS